MQPRALLAPALAFGAGLLHTAAFAPGPGAIEGWLQVAALAVLAVLAMRAASPRSAFVAGFTFGLAWFLGGVSWVYVSMHVYGAMAAPLAATATLGFAAYLALYPAFGCALAAHLARDGGDAARVLAFGAAITLMEMARGYVFTGFPWLAVGYAHTDTPLAGLAPIGGVYATGLAATLVAAAVAALVQPGRTLAGRAGLAVCAVAIVLAGTVLSGLRWAEPSGPPLSVRLVQGNVPQEMKFRPEQVLANMRRYVEMVETGSATLTVLPETAWVIPWQSTPAELQRRLRQHAERTEGWIAIGMPLRAVRDGEPHPTNSVGVLGPGAGPAAHLVGRYDKRHLVPFGEFVPLGFRWFVDLMHIPLGDFGRGRIDQPPIAIGGQKVAFNICYEDIFGEELIDAVRYGGATVLANVSNLAWFGETAALDQHLQIARMRSIETARPSIRATNTGMTAAIDARGRVLAVLPARETGVLEATVTGTTGITPYVRAGNLPVLLAAFALLAAAAWRAGRVRRRTFLPPGRGAGLPSR